MNAVLGLTPPEVRMDKQKTSAEAGEEYRTKNRIIKECLINDAKRAQMNDAMGTTIAKEVYDHSLARVLLMPHLVKDGQCPSYSEGEHGPVVVVHLVQAEKRVLECRAFRDSLREEEKVTTVRDIEFIPMRGHGIRPSSFPLSNVCTLRWPELNGSAYSMVERARQRLLVCLAMDETKVALRALSWVCARFGRTLWAKSVATSESALLNAIAAVGAENNPVIVCSVSTAAKAVDIFDLIGTQPRRRKVDAMIGFKMDDGSVIPVHIIESMPDHMIFVIPSGQAMGEMPIFIEPQVQDYDKPERLIKGWLCFQDQGMVFTGTRLTNAVYLGWRGFVEMVKNFLRRAVAW